MRPSCRRRLREQNQRSATCVHHTACKAVYTNAAPVRFGSVLAVSINQVDDEFTLMGVVRQEVNTSAGRSGLWGNNSLAPHAASKMQSLIGSAALPSIGAWPPFPTSATPSASYTAASSGGQIVAAPLVLISGSSHTHMRKLAAHCGAFSAQ